jgi:ribose transport system ATP-binding protein
MKETLLAVSSLAAGKGGGLLKSATLFISSGETVALLGTEDSGREALFTWLCGQKNVYISPLHTRSFAMMTVSENLLLQGVRNRHPFFWGDKTSGKIVAEMLRKIGIEIDTSAKLSSLSYLQVRLLDFAGFMMQDAPLMLMHENFEGYTDEDRKTLALVMLQFKQKGRSIILNTNDMYAVAGLADKLLLFRGGHLVKKIHSSDLSSVNIASYLYELPPDSKTIKSISPQTKHWNLEVENFEFPVVSGEIINLLVYDVIRKNRLFNNIKIQKHNISDRSKQRLAKIRQLGNADELFANLSIGENLILPSMRKILKFGIFISEKTLNAVGNLYSRDFGDKNRVNELSTSELALLTLERWIIFTADIFILLEPFLHLDEEGREVISRKLITMKNDGRVIVILSSSVHTYSGITDNMAEI